MIRISESKGVYEFYIGYARIRSSNMSCQYCNLIKLSEAYVDFIKKLKSSNLLDKDYKLHCCTCHLILQLAKTIRCYDCGTILSYRVGSYHKYVICSTCDKIYWRTEIP